MQQQVVDGDRPRSPMILSGRWLLLALVGSTAAFNAGPRVFSPRSRMASSAISMQQQVVDGDEMTIGNDAETSMDMASEAPAAQQRFKAITLQSLDTWAEKFPRLQDKLADIKMSSLIFPFKASPYLVEELIDWEMEGDISTDPFYRLIFPTMDMLEPSARATLEEACATKEPLTIKAAVEEIREELNPHPAGQKALNAPKKAELTGVQHKYSETVLFFASAAQTCHAYCTYCFRWAQFIGDADLRFAQKDADSLFDYLEEHEEVSDILFTS